MATGKLNIIKGTGAVLTDSGWVINQTAYLSNLTLPENTIAGLVSAAYNVMTNAGYYIGMFLNFTDTDHYGNVWPIVLDQMDFSTVTPDSQEVGLVWRSRRYGSFKAQFSTGATMEQTNVDYNQTPIVLQYTYPEGHEKAGETEEVGAMVDKLIPERTVEINRTEWIGTPGVGMMKLSDFVMCRKEKYEGKINLYNFTPVPYGTYYPTSGNEGCWMCTAINAITNDSGITYDLSYSFSYRPPVPFGESYYGGWHPEAIFLDPANGRPPGDLTVPTLGLTGDAAWRAVQIYEKVDFTNIWVSL